MLSFYRHLTRPPKLGNYVEKVKMIDTDTTAKQMKDGQC